MTQPESTDRTDRIAREAARLLETGRVPTIGRAIEAAAEQLKLRDSRRPSAGRVRQHLQAMAMQALGERGYAEQVSAILRDAEELMTALEEGLPDAETLLAGRAARGLVDGEGPLHVRVYTEQPIGSIAEVVVQYGYDEPGFATVRTRHGRLNRLVLDAEVTQIVLTRCLPAMRAAADQDLFSGRPVATMTVEELRKALEEESDEATERPSD